MAVKLDYKPTRYEGKGFLHRDITGEMWFGVGQSSYRIIPSGIIVLYITPLDM